MRVCSLVKEAWAINSATTDDLDRIEVFIQLTAFREPTVCERTGTHTRGEIRLHRDQSMVGILLPVVIRSTWVISTGARKSPEHSQTRKGQRALRRTGDDTRKCSWSTLERSWIAPDRLDLCEEVPKT